MSDRQGKDGKDGTHGERGKRGKRGHCGKPGEYGEKGVMGAKGATGPTGPCCTGPTGPQGPTGAGSGGSGTGTGSNLLLSDFNRVQGDLTYFSGLLTTLTKVGIDTALLGPNTILEIVATVSINNNQTELPQNPPAASSVRIDVQCQIRLDGSDQPGGGGTVVGGFTITLLPDLTNLGNPVHGCGSVVFRIPVLAPGFHTIFLDMKPVGGKVTLTNPNPPVLSSSLPNNNASLYVQVMKV